jgi:hypothetical protein
MEDSSMARTLAFTALLMCVGAALMSKQAAAESQYCLAGTTLLMIDSDEATLAKVAASCKVGDIIAIASGGSGGHEAVVRLCDFSKTIADAGRLTECVLGSLRSVRK